MAAKPAEKVIGVYRALTHTGWASYTNLGRTATVSAADAERIAPAQHAAQLAEHGPGPDKRR